MSASVSLVSRVFGRLTVVSRQGSNRHKQALWLCECVCSNKATISTNELKSGDTRSCGCLKAEAGIQKSKVFAGDIFGRLTVLSREPSKGLGIAEWRCQCSCGRIIVTLASRLGSGSSKNCGFHINEMRPDRIIDLTGITFGRLKVLSVVQKAGHGRVKWFCICTCGKQKTITGADLRSGGSQSCGCLKDERWGAALDIKGHIFGRLTALEPHSQTPRGVWKWRCICQCGKESIVRTSSLSKGYTVSCGCAVFNRDPSLRCHAIKLQGNVIAHRRRAKKAGNGGNFTAAQIDDLYRIQKGLCAEPSCRCRLRGKYHIDHIIPVDLGGTNWITNLQLLCPPCNRRKSNKDPIVWAQENGRLL